MTWWLIVLIVLAVLFLLGQIRLGADIRYEAGQLSVAVIAGPVRIPVLPGKERPDKPKKEKQKKQRPEKRRKKKPEAQPEEKPGTLTRILDLLPVVGEAAGALRRKILIRSLKVKIIWAAADAAGAAIGFGRIHGLLGMIWPILDHNFRVKDHDFQVDVDYESHRPEVSFDIALTLTVGQALAFAVHYGAKALSRWSRSGRRSPERQEVKS